MSNTVPPPPGQDPYGQPAGSQFGQPAGGPGYTGAPPVAGGGYAQPSHAYASWGKRFVATLIDNLLYIPGSILLALGMDLTTSTNVNGNVSESSRDGNPLFALIGGLLILAIFVWNRVLKQGKTGQSVGKGVMKIRAINEQSGQPIGAGMAFLRDLISQVLSALCYLPGIINYLFPLWDSKKQTISDKATKSVVVDAV